VVIYLDTSALIKLYFLEQGSEFVHRCVMEQDEPLPVWQMQEAELINACRLKVFWGEITEEQAGRQIDLFTQRIRRGQYFVPEIDHGELMCAFRKLSGKTPRLGCRTMDILHVACALQLSPSLFVSFDSRQRALADHVGLSVAPVDPLPAPA
jgi:predicted nucleic acid-binding protein